MKQAVLFTLMMIITVIGCAGECMVWVTTKETKMFKKDKEDSNVIRTMPAWTVLRPYDGLTGVTCSAAGRKGDWTKVQFPSIVVAGGGYDRGWVRFSDVASVNCPTKAFYHYPADAFEPDTLNACIMKYKAEKAISKLQTGYSFSIIDAPEITAEINRVSYVIRFGLEGSGVAVKIDNKTQTPMKIIWDQSVIITPAGESLPVIHQGVKLIDSDKPQSPSMIAPGAYIKDIIAPRDGVTWTDVGWDAGPLFSDSEDPVGKQIGVMLAIETSGAIRYETIKLEVIESPQQ